MLFTSRKYIFYHYHYSFDDLSWWLWSTDWCCWGGELFPRMINLLLLSVRSAVLIFTIIILRKSIWATQIMLFKDRPFLLLKITLYWVVLISSMTIQWLRWKIWLSGWRGQWGSNPGSRFGEKMFFDPDLWSWSSPIWSLTLILPSWSVILDFDPNGSNSSDRFAEKILQAEDFFLYL